MSGTNSPVPQTMVRETEEGPIMIRVNDKWDILWHEGMTVADVLAACSFTVHYVAISINGKLVPPSQHERAPVADGDQVQVVHIIAGG